MPEEELLHITQNHPVNEPTSVRINVGCSPSALIALNPKKFPQQLCDLVFERTFSVTNTWENRSVVLSRYRTNEPANTLNYILHVPRYYFLILFSHDFPV